jgi:hypothetical protein
VGWVPPSRAGAVSCAWGAARGWSATSSLSISMHSKRTFLCCRGQPPFLAEVVVEVTGERAFDAAVCLSGGLARCEEPAVVGAGLGVVAGALERDDVQRPVKLAIAAAVEPVVVALPLEALTGLVPASAAKDDSLVIRLGWPLETSSWAPQTGSTPPFSSRSGATSVNSPASARSGAASSFESRSRPVRAAGAPR